MTEINVTTIMIWYMIWYTITHCIPYTISYPANYGDKAIRAASQGEMISVSEEITKEVNQIEPNRIIFAKFQNSNCE